MDLFLLDKGEDILKQGCNSLNLLKDIDYINIIKRSMNSNEICLGRTDESNLRKDSIIEIGKLKNAAYNLIEEDVYSYLKKLRRRNRNLKLEYYIDEFVKINNLNSDSRDYIIMLLSIPSDTLKQWIRYKEGKKKNSPDQYLKVIERTLEYENFKV